MRTFSYVFAATMVARLSSLISFPVTTRTLTVADMGELTIWHTLRGLILLAVFAGLPDIVAREAGVHHSQKAFYSALKLSATLLSLVALCMETVLALAPGWITVPYPRLLIVAAAIDIVPGLFLTTQAAMGRVGAYAVCIMAPAVTASLTTVMLVLPPFSMGIVGPLYAHVAASGLNALICAWLLFRHREPVGSPAQPPANLLRQSIPILGVSLVGMSIVTVDRYSIHWISGAQSLGFYAVAFQAAALLSFGGSAVRTSSMAKIISNIEKPVVIQRYFNDYLMCAGMFALLLAALAPEVIRVLAGAKYEAQVQLAPILCAAILGLELYSFGQALAVARRDSQRAFKSILAAAVVAVLLAPPACMLLGATGVSIALLIAYAVAAITVLARQSSLTPVSISTLAGVVVALIALTAHYGQVANVHSPVSMALRYVLAFLCAGVGLMRLRALGRETTP